MIHYVRINKYLFGVYCMFKSFFTGKHGKIGVLALMIAAFLLSTCVMADEDNKKYTIKTVPGDYAIQADVNLTGSGSGFHAKLLVCTATAATSFGIQFDKHTIAPYTAKAAFMVENIRSNYAGGQDYSWIGQSALGVTSRMMLAFQKKTGTVTMYINGYKVGSVKNPNLRNQSVVMRVEASARKSGDAVSASFSNIKLKRNGKYKKSYKWDTRIFNTGKGLKANIINFTKKSKNIVISGKLSGISSEQDWDSAYENVSGIVQFED